MTAHRDTVEATGAEGVATPVVLVVFNRPEATRQVLDALAAVRPQTLYVAADGPRHAEDVPKCAAVRELISDPPWKCRVHRDIADANLGCGRRLPTALDWVFAHEERAIILEDDCVPHPSFFSYCEDLLTRYADDSSVGCISGDTIPGTGNYGKASYRFSWIPLIWGWATWRRAWRKYDHEVSDWRTQQRAPWLRRIAPEALMRMELIKKFSSSYEEASTSAFSIWDFQWTYACMRHGMRSIHPRDVLVSNVGFGPDATHTRGAAVTRHADTGMPMPLTHPRSYAVDVGSDIEVFHALHRHLRRDRRSLAHRMKSTMHRVAMRLRSA